MRSGVRSLMPSICPHRRGFRAHVRLKGHRAMSRVFSSREEAETWAHQVERELREGRKVDGRRRRLSDAIDLFLEAHQLTAHQQNLLEWWRRELGHRRVADLKRGDFYEARDRIRAADGGVLAPATVNRRLALISAVLTMVMERDWVSVNVARIRRLPEDNARERLLGPDERARLLAACRASPEPDLYPLVVCAMLSGGRAGELVGLTWQYVDLEHGIGRLARTKSRVPRPIPLRGHALDVLRELAERRPDATQTDHVFRHAGGRAPFQYDRPWRRARDAAGIRDFHFHDLRHLAASELAMAGTSTRELQQMLGHSSAQMTARYSHFVPEHVVELGDILSSRIFGTSASTLESPEASPIHRYGSFEQGDRRTSESGQHIP